MSYNRQRRVRGTGKATVALNVHIDPTAKAKIDRVADALGRSQGQVLDLIVSHFEFDGTPVRRDERLSTGESVDAAADLVVYSRQRRTRGTGKLTVALNVHIDTTAKDKIDRVADKLGRSQGQVLDLMLNHTEVDANGRPEFWDGPLATDYQRELPMASSA